MVQNRNGKKWCPNKDLSWGGQGRTRSWVWAVASQDLENGCCCLDTQDRRMGASLYPSWASCLVAYLSSIALRHCWGL